MLFDNHLNFFCRAHIVMSENFVANDTRWFRPEIEGLRAVAATLVMVYHIFLGRVSGGVDVFFLIAGFLITGSLLRQVERTGKIMPGAFLVRLAKRLLPNSLTVLAVVIVGTWIWVPLTQHRATFREITASTLYYENWSLISKATDYLAHEEVQSPVQHFWAMSIQGQFYIIWLVLFAVALLFGRKGIRGTLGILLGIVFVVSFAFSVYYTNENQPVAYFHTGTRVWEFAAGGLFALFSLKIPRISEKIRVPISWMGLAAIIFLGTIIPVSTLFPGYIAIIPIFGGLLILLAGPSKSRWSATTLLGSRPMVYLGGVSYGLYLWHWPILIFYKHYTGREIVGPRSGVAIILLSLILAVVSTRFVERPLRGSAQNRNRIAKDHPRKLLRPASIALICVTAVAVSAAAAGNTVRIGHAKLDQNRIATDYPGALARAGADSAEVPEVEAFYPDYLAAAIEKPEHYEKGCHQDQASSEIIECAIGAEADDVIPGTPKIIVVGGSHSRS